MTLIYFFIGIGLSMDAFSLALSVGTTSPTKKQILILSLLIGIFHFIMPILGYLIGIYIHDKIIGISYLTCILFIFLAYELYKNKDNEENLVITISTSLLISLGVSIDSLTVGVALGLNNEFILIASIIFSFISMTFTYTGLIIGKTIQNKLKDKAIYIGIFLLLIVALKYLITSNL